MGKRKTWYLVSAAVIGLSILATFTKGFHYGIDFLGGTELIVEFSAAPDVGKIRTMMDQAGYNRSEIKQYGTASRVLIRTEHQEEGTVVGDKIKASLTQTFPDLHPTVLSTQKIGPKVGAELRRNALLAVLTSLIAMGLYVAFRFEFIYGLGALVALLHDVIVALGFVCLFDGLTSFMNFEVDQNMIAAFLTIVGLSMNDTVVILDRIRENRKIYRSMGLAELINKSLNETLSRTIITSGTVLLITVILFLFGGEVNRGFAFALTIGIITGTYSSIYIASAIALDYINRKQSKKSANVTSAGKPRYETVQ